MMGRLILCLAAFATGATPALASKATDIVTAGIDGFIRPGYSAFRDSAAQLSLAGTALCAAPSQQALDAARASFGAAVDAWSRIEIIRFGPVTEENRLERILFWPDRKSIGLKQVQAAIASEDVSAADPASLAGKSVAMQGLGALEFVLFGTGADDLRGATGAYRCRYGQAIATNLNTMASGIVAAWASPAGIAAQWANPGAENPLYRSDDEAMTELFNVFVHGLEMIRDVRINGFLGQTSDDDKARQAIYWRSDGTMISIASGLEGLQRLLEAADLSGLLDDETNWIPDSIGFELTNAEKALQDADGPLVEVLRNAEKRKKLEYARLVTSSLSELFGVRLAGALGLSAGFSSLDGD